MELETLAIIPARGGSKALPRKNIRLLNGKPMIYYTIKEALESNLLNTIIVSTEDKEVADIATKYGVQVIERPLQLAHDNTPSLPVFQHAIAFREETDGYHPDLVVILQATSPLRKVADIDGAIEKLLQTGCDSVVSVCEVEHPLHWMFTLDGDRLSPIFEGREEITRRQDAPKVYRLNGAVYVTYRDVIMKQNRVIGEDTIAYIMPPERSIDIDTELDFRFAEFLIKERECQ